jgi:hypothetical protein
LIFQNYTNRTGVFEYMGMHSRILVYPSIQDHIPIDWGTPYTGTLSRIFGYPCIREYILVYRGTHLSGKAFPHIGSSPVYGNGSPYTGIPQYLGMHPRILGNPSVRAYAFRVRLLQA